MRLALVLLGLGLAGVGAFEARHVKPEDMFNFAVWLVGGVAAHDLVFAPLVLVVGVIGAAKLSRWARTPVTVGSVVLVTVTIAVVPTIGRFGARPDNPTLLDRPYGLGWMLFAGAVLLGTAAGCVFSRRHAQRSE